MKYSTIKDYWDRCDKMHTDISDKGVHDIADVIINELQVTKNDKVLDIGCGDGMIDNKIKCTFLSGYDISEYNIKKAQELNPINDYFVNDFLDVPFSKEIFNKIFSYGVMQYCKPKDYKRFIILSLYRANDETVIIHFDIPDKSRMINLFGYAPKGLLKYCFYRLFWKWFPIWNDGSHFHNIDKMVKFVEHIGYKAVKIDCKSKYRTSLKITK